MALQPLMKPLPPMFTLYRTTILRILKIFKCHALYIIFVIIELSLYISSFRPINNNNNNNKIICTPNLPVINIQFFYGLEVVRWHRFTLLLYDDAVQTRYYLYPYYRLTAPLIHGTKPLQHWVTHYRLPLFCQTTHSFQHLYKAFRAVEHTQLGLNHVQMVRTEFFNTIEFTLPL